MPHRLGAQVIATLTDYHGPTALHSLRVAHYGTLVLPCCGATFRDALLCHDAGKRRIALALLDRLAPLRPPHWTALRQHPAHGLTALEALCPHTLARLYTVVTLYHHERWDGTGYPLGLRGRAIPWPARACAILDAFDALTTRLYRTPLPPPAAATLLLQDAGTHFDPALVRLLAPRLVQAARLVIPEAPHDPPLPTLPKRGRPC